MGEKLVFLATTKNFHFITVLALGLDKINLAYFVS